MDNTKAIARGTVKKSRVLVSLRRMRSEEIIQSNISSLQGSEVTFESQRVVVC